MSHDGTHSSAPGPDFDEKAELDELVTEATWTTRVGEVSDTPTANTLLERLKQIQTTDFATETTLAAQLDITLSALRDALRGAGGDTLTDVHNALDSVETKLQTLIDQTDQVETLLDQHTPETHATLFNTSVTAGANILATSVTPNDAPTHFRIYATFDTSGILTVRRNNGGAATLTEELNAGNTLDANAAYVFDILVHAGQSINLRYSVDATAKQLSIVEVTSGA